MSKLSRTILLLLMLWNTLPLHAQDTGKAKQEVTLNSPDGKIRFQLEHRFEGGKRALYYTVHFKDQPVVLPSEMDIQLDNHISEQAMALKVDKAKKWCEDLRITNIVTSSANNTWKPVYGERASVKDHYNQAVMEMLKENNPMYKMNVQVRVYNEGVAFRYFFPENEKGTYYRVVAENTAFTLPEGTMAWHAAWAQAPYTLLPLRNWTQESERPLTLELPGGTYACLAEAAMTDYSRTKFKLGSKPNTILTSMHDPADLISPVGTPWRVIMLAETPGKLAENNDLLLNLNKPSTLRNTDWIKPGKIMRVMTQTTKDAYENIDFAAAHSLQYILFDWKWYGPAFSFDSDATTVSIPDFDLPGIIAYGKQKGIGVWLYVNQQALLMQSDSLFRVYKDWGVKGVKFGFVQVGSHRWTTWIQKAIQQAADAEMMVNIHDEYRPTGEQRTWPNFMTSEGIRGNEEMPDATHNTVLPFTRMIAGAGDYTVCYYDKRIKTTHAHQLALSVVMYSPIQTLFWYDKPAAYNGEPEVAFFEKVPADWDETHILQGKPGVSVATARRKGNQWFIGAITNNEARTLQLPLAFLEKGKKYTATIYADDPSVPTKTKVSVKKMNVTAATVLKLVLQPSGGQAIHIVPNEK